MQFGNIGLEDLQSGSIFAFLIPLLLKEPKKIANIYLKGTINLDFFASSPSP